MHDSKFTLNTQLPLALYIHIPWCVRKCPYCDFNSHQVGDELPESEYISALIRDLEQDLPLIWGRRISSIFIGGGTPSLLSASAMDRLLSEIRARLVIIPDAEITLEANPGASEQSKFNEFNAIGINRLSIGVQSFDDQLLNKIGRIHSGAEAIKAVEMAHVAGFDNLNIDLMFALPSQDKVQALHDVNTAIDLEPSHMSYYQLTIEPHTFFASQPPTLPTEDELWEMQTNGQERLSLGGFSQYEVSAYCQEDRQCQHNINYWQFGDYLGIGAGAHAKITDIKQQSITRLSKIKQPKQYMNSAGSNECLSSKVVLDESDLGIEFMMNALRLSDGFDKTLFEERTGRPLSIVSESLEKAQQKQLLEISENRVDVTERGKRFLNDLLAMF